MQDLRAVTESSWFPPAFGSWVVVGRDCWLKAVSAPGVLFWVHWVPIQVCTSPCWSEDPEGTESEPEQNGKQAGKVIGSPPQETVTTVLPSVPGEEDT